MTSRKKAGPDLAVLLDVGPKKAAAPIMDEESEYGGEFEAAAAEAFPDLADSPERTDAFWRAVAACVERLRGE